MAETVIACVVIAGGQRTQLLDDVILPTVAGFDEVVVVGEHHDGPYRYLHVSALSHTTNDALVKRDVGTVATKAEVLVYLSDDHRLGEGFADHLRGLTDELWDVLVPQRFVLKDGRKLALSMGAEVGYCGGHAGVFRRALIQRLPWSAGPHHPNWDLFMSASQRQLGAHFLYGLGLEIWDVEPGAEPWR